MGLMKQRILGAFGELRGRLKKAVGAARHDRALEARGEAEAALGRLRRRGAEALEHGLGAAEGSVGKAQQKLEEISGEARQDPNR